MPSKHEQSRPAAWDVRAGTHAAFERVIDAEAATREAKTGRLRVARLDRAVSEPRSVASRKPAKAEILRPVLS